MTELEIMYKNKARPSNRECVHVSVGLQLGTKGRQKTLPIYNPNKLDISDKCVCEIYH